MKNRLATREVAPIPILMQPSAPQPVIPVMNQPAQPGNNYN